jgi:hypothetical protein
LNPLCEGSANIVKYSSKKGKTAFRKSTGSRYQEKFIEEQIGKTVDALNRDRLYSLLGQEVEREMMARNREQFGFRMIDSPRIPDTKSKPGRGPAALLATLFAGLAFSIYFCARDRRKRTGDDSVSATLPMDAQ